MALPTRFVSTCFFHPSRVEGDDQVLLRAAQAETMLLGCPLQALDDLPGQRDQVGRFRMQRQPSGLQAGLIE